MKDNMKLFKKVISVLCIMVMITSLMACGNNKPAGGDSTSNGTETESMTETGTDTDNTEFSENDSETEIGTETDTETETETATESGTGTGSEGGQTGAGNNTSDKNDTTVTNPDGDELLGQGSKAEPLYETPQVEADKMVLATVSIGAQKSVYYNIYRVGGLILTINDANAYVVCDGKRYDAVNGVLSFQVVDALASDAVAFEIGNKGASSASFTITFTNPLGSDMNPQIISSADGSACSVHISEGEQIGYYYKYVAEKNGMLIFYVKSVSSNVATAKGCISATNNSTYANRTTDADGVQDGEYVKIELRVKAGQEVIIVVGVAPTSTWNYPEADITWVMEYK